MELGKGGVEIGIRKGRCRKWAQEWSVPKLGSEKVGAENGFRKKGGAENRIRKGRYQKWAQKEKRGLRKGWCRKYDQERSMPKMGSEKGGAENGLGKGRCRK